MSDNEKLIIASLFGPGKVLDDAMKIRRAVFMLEENVSPADEIDGQDGHCLHYVGYVQDWQPATTSRIYTVNHDSWHIGRVATFKNFRGKGFASQLLKQIEIDAKKQHIKKLELEAQVHAISFYENLGYAAYGDIFLDANIQHRKMQKILTA
ncbi:MAG: GNAT family N-acetyltransferase [Oenococcus sp.]|uniref:GNAT family N-acetyltransferase n=1 Tax=Oenococcus TaxID=46254 RepID=UPI0021E75899|nr:GNAT family N-acetyltransferase [Oenococcus kitaharae]MCV3296298.1 GNAT family N-acetyltransferase [Oenococcus kitaharae]